MCLCCFMGDALRVRQVLLNLCNNAVKFTDEGSVSLRVRAVDSTNTRVRLEFVVRDCGIGIPESEIGRIFSPFMQVDESATRRFGGTGLGACHQQAACGTHGRHADRGEPRQQGQYVPG